MIEKNKLGVGLFIASEAVFFVILILAFIYFRSSWVNLPSPNPADNLHPLTTGFFSIALFASSGTTWFAERSLKRGDRRILNIGLGLTILLGMIFLFGQGREYAELIRNNVTISQNLFGTTFFTLTGFHGLHVLVGLTMLTILLGLSVLKGSNPPGEKAVSAISLYWHFVDAVWVVIFSVIYVWTVLL